MDQITIKTPNPKVRLFLTQVTCKGIWRQLFICLRPLTSVTQYINTVRTPYLLTQGRGRRGSAKAVFFHWLGGLEALSTGGPFLDWPLLTSFLFSFRWCMWSFYPRGRRGQSWGCLLSWGVRVQGWHTKKVAHIGLEGGGVGIWPLCSDL